VDPDYRAMQDHSEGVSGGSSALSKIPVIGRSMDWYENFLFKRYIPALKARAGEALFDRYRDAHRDWSEEKVARVAAQHGNDMFGGQDWRSMGRSATTQDWARLLLLAPDWMESTLRSGARLFDKSEGNVGRAQMAKITLGLWGAARVGNMLSTGDPHYEAPFGVVNKDENTGKETVYSMRTLPVDLLHAVADPTGFLKGRLSPFVRATDELYNQRDQYGRKLTPLDTWTDVFRNMAPLPLQALGKTITGSGPDLTNTDQVVKAIGGTATVYRTEAQKLASELASNHTEDGVVDSALLERHKKVMQLEDELRSGRLALPDLYARVYDGELSQLDAKRIVDNVRQTHGMTADAAALYTRASRLPTSALLQVYDVATPTEKQVLTPLVRKSAVAYLKKSVRSLTPAERRADPTLARVRQLLPNATPF